MDRIIPPSGEQQSANLIAHICIVILYLGLDRGYKWLESSFSTGDFKYVTKQTSREKIGKKESEEASEGGAYPCPQDGCIRVFQRISSLERHLWFEKYTTSLERLSLLDLAKTEYASILCEGITPMPTLPSMATRTGISSAAQEGWALRETKKAYCFNEKQRRYLEAKFNLGQTTGRKLDLDIVAKEMRQALGSDGKRLFKPSEFLTVQQRLSNKVRQQ